ncbi:capsular polysaccharide transport system permease protein [Cognatiyoonia koreensis]|uniref:Transport permease protein n=1 Tax=Cognatiyoonia koreensis TaxID=364200 RepID=A0A1I0RQC1_9RHOB|nr:ABC transporter permease [Cognatiyoonia koreensis]SEW43483.1 capsular polysaccharide transport system permease protein [Cognatiyoonia koreensis]
MSIALYPDRIAALIRRERLTRFSGGVIGHFWAYLTPIAWIAFVVILFHALNRAPPIYVPAEIFVATGILPYLAFRQTITSLSRAIPANRSLLYLPQVTSHDILTASGLRDGLNLIISALVIFGGITLIYGNRLPADAAQVVTGLALAWFLAIGVGRFIAAVGLISDSFARFVPILLRPVFWLSGIFYTATELPPAVQDALWYSPLLHVTEIVREGYFLGYTSPVATVWYPVFCGAFFYVVASPIETAIMRRRIARYRL